ncbi:MAG: hypothetical protein IJL70_05580 [Treponema sp.]|nr:hypothetical protein [Treponema sp.]
MRICKRFVLCVTVFAFAAEILSAQMKMPEMPSITNISDGPAMPHISAPTFGSTFYVPGNIYTRKKSEVTIKSADNNVSEKTVSQSSGSMQEKLSAVFGINSYGRLTADDVSMLGSNGYFNGVYSILGNSWQSQNVPSVSATKSDVLLEKVMEQLEALKVQNARLSAFYDEQKKYKSASVVPSSIEKEPKILRFVVNGRNLLDTCRTVFFSNKEYDGSFLLTGDRKYDSNGKSREETFYLLFKADGNCGSEAGFDVEPSVVQDYKNEHSYLYQLSEKHNLKAEKTGNLVALRCNEAAWNMDLLLDIGSE